MAFVHGRTRDEIKLLNQVTHGATPRGQNSAISTAVLGSCSSRDGMQRSSKVTHVAPTRPQAQFLRSSWRLPVCLYAQVRCRCLSKRWRDGLQKCSPRNLRSAAAAPPLSPAVIISLLLMLRQNRTRTTAPMPRHGFPGGQCLSLPPSPAEDPPHTAYPANCPPQHSLPLEFVCSPCHHEPAATTRSAGICRRSSLNLYRMPLLKQLMRLLPPTTLLTFRYPSVCAVCRFPLPAVAIQLLSRDAAETRN